MNSMNSFSNGDAAYHREQNEIQRLQVALSATIKQRDNLLDVVKHLIDEVPMTSSQYELCRQTIAGVKGETK